MLQSKALMHLKEFNIKKPSIISVKAFKAIKYICLMKVNPFILLTSKILLGLVCFSHSQEELPDRSFVEIVPRLQGFISTPADPFLKGAKIYRLSPSEPGFPYNIDHGSRNVVGYAVSGSNIVPCVWSWNQNIDGFHRTIISNDSGWAAGISQTGGILNIVGSVFVRPNPPVIGTQTGFFTGVFGEELLSHPLGLDRPFAANDVNALGGICGWYTRPGTRSSAFYQHPDWTYTLLDAPPTPGGESDYVNARATDDMVVVGEYHLPTYPANSGYRACKWTIADDRTYLAERLPNVADSGDSSALDYHNGMAVGYTTFQFNLRAACLWYRGRVHFLNHALLANSEAQGVCRSVHNRNHYYIVGRSEMGPFLAVYDVVRHTAKLRMLRMHRYSRDIFADAARLETANAVNAFGDIVGTTIDRATGEGRAYCITAPPGGWGTD